MVPFLGLSSPTSTLFSKINYFFFKSVFLFLLFHNFIWQNSAGWKSVIFFNSFILKGMKLQFLLYPVSLQKPISLTGHDEQGEKIEWSLQKGGKKWFIPKYNRKKGEKKKKMATTKINKNVGQVGDLALRFYLSFTDINRQNVVDQQI